MLVLGGDRSMIELGNRPWPREVHAELLSGPLAEAQTVACDILLVDGTTREQDAALARAITNHGNVVPGSALSCSGTPWSSWASPPPARSCTCSPRSSGPPTCATSCASAPPL